MKGSVEKELHTEWYVAIIKLFIDPYDSTQIWITLVISKYDILMKPRIRRTTKAYDKQKYVFD